MAVLDLLLRDTHVLTLDDERPVAHTVGVLHGRIVGVDEEVDGLAARSVVECDGAVVTPGFADAHNHMAWYGLSLAELDLTTIDDLTALYDAVARRAARAPADGWVIGAGYDDFALGGHPRRAELDRAAGGRPVWLKHRSAHMGVGNGVVLDRAGVLDGTAVVPPGGEIDRDAAGEPTGLLKEGAQNLVKALLVPYPASELAAAIARAARVYVAEGLTHVTEAGIGGGWIGHSGVEALAYQLAREDGRLPLRVELMTAAEVLHGLPAHPDDAMPAGLDLGLRTGFGDDRLRLGPMKIFTDGALSSRTAAVGEPYCDHGGTGLLADEPGALGERIVAAHLGGWRVAAHAIGDRAIDVALDAFAEAQRRRPRPDARHRVEHAAMVRPDQLPRLVELGLVPVPQARFLHEIGTSMAEAVGPARVPWLYRHRSLGAAGLVVPGSSDRPCVAVGAPLAGMASMVERATRDGAVLAPEEAVDATEALRAYTTHSAYASHAERERGRIAAGLLADLVVLDADPTTVPGIAHVGVLATFVGGECVHGAESIALRPTTPG